MPLLYSVIPPVMVYTPTLPVVYHKEHCLVFGIIDGQINRICYKVDVVQDPGM